MSIIISSDLHLTDKDRDEYRWGLFPWLEEQINIYKPDILMFLGDTTDAKDKHSAKLTNRIVDTFTRLSKIIKEFYILRGNHDYIDEATPFFKFLNHITNIEFIVTPKVIELKNELAVLIPNTKNFDRQLIDKFIPDVSYIFCHQTFKGAIVENGMPMEGISPEIFKGWNGRVISGDVHVPQSLYKGKVEYVGAPYHIRYNDTFLPRVVFLQDDGKIKSLHYETLKKHTLYISNPSEIDNYKLKKGDQVKIKLSLDDPSDWENFKSQLNLKCKKLEVDLHQIEFIKKNFSLPVKEQSKIRNLTIEELFNQYCKHAKLNDVIKNYGQSILDEINNGKNN
jgi:DNA repair exonuclease SbcCD nuclease subunit